MHGKTTEEFFLLKSLIGDLRVRGRPPAWAVFCPLTILRTPRSTLWKLPQLMEIKKEAFGDFFLMISTSCLEKPPHKPLRLFHSYPSADGAIPITLKNKRGQFFQRRLTLMAAMEIRKKRGFPQPQGTRKRHKIYATPAAMARVSFSSWS
jgi:hypothetical protein